MDSKGDLVELRRKSTASESFGSVVIFLIFCALSWRLGVFMRSVPKATGGLDRASQYASGAAVPLPRGRS
ncbi:MAG: hypothetical protein R2827_03640 [Bdellovibrionales bacterium]